MTRRFSAPLLIIFHHVSFSDYSFDFIMKTGEIWFMVKTPFSRLQRTGRGFESLHLHHLLAWSTFQEPRRVDLEP
jgi:hypothetical protein